MNPLRIFDYVFYCITMLFDRVFGYKQSCEEAGITLLSMLQTFNVLIIGHWLIKCSFFKEFLGLVVIFIIIFGLNIIRYKRIVRYRYLTNKWDFDISNAIRIFKISLVIIYVLLSFIVLGIGHK